ncbi:hypothetical protein SRABI106_03290 [Rahnella aquatilis]|nr:hypothetical protein SRABI106_03290 [Rahnella aquatilis]
MFQIQQTTRRCDQHIHTTVQYHHLRVDAHTTKYHQRTQGEVCAVGLYVFTNLRRQLTGWGQDQRTNRATSFELRVGMAEHIEQRQGKTSGFTGTGLRTRHQVTAFQHDRNSLTLNRRRFAIALFFNSTQNFGT